MSIKIIFIAGPFRAANAWEIAENIRRAERLAHKVNKIEGCFAYCPHANTAHFDGALDDRVYLEGNLELLRRCDALILVEGWEESEGTAAEIAYAKEMDILVCCHVFELQHYKQKYWDNNSQ